MAFKKGQSGNPSGRPRQPEAVVKARERASNLCPELVGELHKIATGAGQEPRDRIKAAEVLLKVAGAFDDSGIPLGKLEIVVKYADR